MGTIQLALTFSGEWVSEWQGLPMIGLGSDKKAIEKVCLGMTQIYAYILY